VGHDGLKDDEGVDAPGIAGKGDELQQRLIELGRGDPGPDGRADRALQRRLPP
jgi:hypothetical protein